MGGLERNKVAHFHSNAIGNAAKQVNANVYAAVLDFQNMSLI